jgi:hypothetical protein
VNRDERVSMIFSKLAVIHGCGRAVDNETRNTPDSRHKGRMIQRAADDIMDLLREMMKPSEGIDQASNKPSTFH